MTEHKEDFKGVAHATLVSFKSGHYKKFNGVWQGDSVWGHFKTEKGNIIHINKDEVEYIETFPPEEKAGA